MMLLLLGGESILGEMGSGSSTLAILGRKVTLDWGGDTQAKKKENKALLD